MSTVFSVENTQFQFIEVTGQYSLVGNNWIYNYIKCPACEKTLKEKYLSNGIVAVQSAICHCDKTYFLNFSKTLKKIEGEFLLVGKMKEEYYPLTEEQANFILSNIDNIFYEE